MILPDYSMRQRNDRCRDNYLCTLNSRVQHRRLAESHRRWAMQGDNRNHEGDCSLQSDDDWQEQGTDRRGPEHANEM